MPILHAETMIFPATLLADDSPFGTLDVLPEDTLDGSLVGSLPASADGDEASSASSDCHWWVAHTKSRQEKSLARELVVSEVPFYLPLVAKERVTRGRKVKSWVPLFGGYLFMYGSKSQEFSRLQTNRICSLLRVDDAVQLVDELRSIKQLIESDAALTVERRLEAGRQVRVTAGPFAGAEGTVITRRGRSRLFVAVTFLQQGISLEIDDFMLEPID
jgi:transcription antitermination factor NusG